MSTATVTFLSPKGYGIAEMENSSLVFLPRCLARGLNPQDEILVEIEMGEKGLRAKKVSIPRPT